MVKFEKQVEQYLGRAKHDSNVVAYPLDEVAIYEIVGGIDGSGSASGLSSGARYEIKNRFVNGRFIDVLKYALKQRDFCGWYCGLNNLDNQNHGFVKKVEAKKLNNDDSLDEIIEQYKKYNVKAKSTNTKAKTH